MKLSIWQMFNMTPAERQAHLDAGGTVGYPASFWTLVVFGVLSAWFILAAINREPSPQRLDELAEMETADRAELACFKQLKSGARNPTTFEVERTGNRKTDQGYLAEIWFSSANAFGVRYEYSGICEVVDGEVVRVNIGDR